MTYGENSGLLREALGLLLRQHRIQERIGGAGTHTVPVTHTPAERADIGRQIRRYRHGILLWCHQAVTASSPAVAGSTRVERRPVADLDDRLREALGHSTDGLPSMAELTTRQDFELVDTWRPAARAAALGEHDFPAGVHTGALNHRQSLTVLTDAAQIARAVVMLDKRYDKIPAWQRLHKGGYLARAARSCDELLDLHDTDLSVDHLGWRPTPPLTVGPAGPGMEGVLRAEQNLLAHLNRFPNGINLKRIINSQRALSHHLAAMIRTSDPVLSDTWQVRAETYTRLYAEARNLTGLIGDGAPAAAAGAVALDRLREVGTATLEPGATRALSLVFTRIDHRVTDAIEHGIRHGLYLSKTSVPEIDVHDGRLVHGPRELFVPISSPVQTNLLTVAREQLRPKPHPPPPTQISVQSRLDFRSALTHRPGDREHRGTEL